LSREKRYVESLPYFRAALGRVRTDFMEIHRDYAGALYSATFELGPGGSALPRVRSSLERVRMLQEALAEFGRALRFDMPPAERASVLTTCGTLLQAWGFPWEALLKYRGAYDVDPAGKDRAARVLAFMNLMRHPDRYTLDSVPVQP
jgi:tetratricopeptide (TPR) repeat protein